MQTTRLRVTLGGEGLLPSLTVNPSTINFGDVVVGTLVEVCLTAPPPHPLSPLVS